MGDTLSGKVVGVADGDTITVLDVHHQQHRIRLGGIDAPEKAQPYGQRSKESMSTVVFGKEVDVQWSKHDSTSASSARYGASPDCRASLPKTLDAGLAQLTVGLAWWYRKYAKEQSAEDARRYEFAEQEARAKHAGLWADGQPIPPWDGERGRTFMKQKQWPATIDEAVGVVIATVSDNDKATIAPWRSLNSSACIWAWAPGFGTTWGCGGNRPLLESTGAPNADDASMVIVVAVWERLREMVPKVH